MADLAVHDCVRESKTQNASPTEAVIHRKGFEIMDSLQRGTVATKLVGYVCGHQKKEWLQENPTLNTVPLIKTATVESLCTFASNA